MIPNIDQIGQLSDVARNGSPVALVAVGRAFGLGEEERRALLKGGIPWWTLLLAGAAIGFVAGTRAEKKYSSKIPSWISGK
jgi:hypothetical protein